MKKFSTRLSRERPACASLLRAKEAILSDGFAGAPVVAGVMVLFLASLMTIGLGVYRRPVTSDASNFSLAVAPKLVDINVATAAELSLLPRIGPELSRRIVADREANGLFRTVDELDRVRGIGERTILTIRPYVCAGQ